MTTPTARLAPVCTALAAALSLALAPALAGLAPAYPDAPARVTTTKTATFRAGTPLYVLGGTTGPFNTLVNGKVTFTDAAANQLTAVGAVRGLAGNTRYVVVAYKDSQCLPTPGLTAFPSTAFTTNATGYAKVNVTVSATSINPVGTLQAAQINSVSVRQVLINGVALPYTVPNNPYPATPQVPNVAYVEACDRAPR